MPTRAVRDAFPAGPGDGTVAGRPPRFPAIDGLRATAILVVMVSHAGLGRVVPGGFGVTIFFFLSGYLITTLLRLERDASGRISLAAFYTRRAMRILPPLYLTMTLTAVLVALRFMPGQQSVGSLVGDLFFLTNYAPLLGLPATSPIPLWSLDVEEHFYLVFPAIFIVLGGMGARRQAGVLLALCALVLAVRVATYPTAARAEIYYWSHTRIDSIIWGALLAVWQNPVLARRPWRPTRWQVACAIGAIVLTFVVRDDRFRETLRYTVQGAALLVVFSAAIQARGRMTALLNSRVLKVVATLSYTLYLAHLPMLRVCESRVPPLAAAPLAVALAFGWACLMFVLVERPLSRWRRRSLAARVDNRTVALRS